MVRINGTHLIDLTAAFETFLFCKITLLTLFPSLNCTTLLSSCSSLLVSLSLIRAAFLSRGCGAGGFQGHRQVTPKEISPFPQQRFTAYSSVRWFGTSLAPFPCLSYVSYDKTPAKASGGGKGMCVLHILCPLRRQGGD